MSIFDGMGSLSVGVFGSDVTVTPVGGASRTVKAIFREQPESIVNSEGYEIITVMPTLSGVANLLSDLVPDGVVNPGNGHQYRCIAPMKSGSPAVDALHKIQLEKIDAPQ